MGLSSSPFTAFSFLSPKSRQEGSRDCLCCWESWQRAPKSWTNPSEPYNKEMPRARPYREVGNATKEYPIPTRREEHLFWQRYKHLSRRISLLPLHTRMGTPVTGATSSCPVCSSHPGCMPHPGWFLTLQPPGPLLWHPLAYHPQHQGLSQKRPSGKAAHTKVTAELRSLAGQSAEAQGPSNAFCQSEHLPTKGRTE